VTSDKRRQRYDFVIARADTIVGETQCEFFASEKGLAARGGWEVVLGEDAELACTVTRGTASDTLNVRTSDDAALAGSFSASRRYRVQGIGVNPISRGMTGPVGGFHIFLHDAPIAAVQIINDKRVTFARGLDQQQRDELVPAIAALLLLDESLAEF
jgi:hypothetical protein